MDLVPKEMTDRLEHGETVKLSSFGFFVMLSKGARMSRSEVWRGANRAAQRDGVHAVRDSQTAPRRSRRRDRMNGKLFPTTLSESKSLFRARPIGRLRPDHCAAHPPKSHLGSSPWGRQQRLPLSCWHERARQPYSNTVRRFGTLRPGQKLLVIRRSHE